MMLQRLVEQRAARIRILLTQGTFAHARVPLRNGGTLPAERFAKVARDDPRSLSTTQEADGDSRIITALQRRTTRPGTTDADRCGTGRRCGR